MRTTDAAASLKHGFENRVSFGDDEAKPSIVYFEDFEIDVDCFELRRNGRPIPVQPLVFSLLVYLSRQSGRVACKDELIRYVWHGTIVSDGAIAQAISLLRKALGDDARRSPLIRTVHRRGYRFVADIVTTMRATTRTPHGNAGTGAAW